MPYHNQPSLFKKTSLFILCGFIFSNSLIAATEKNRVVAQFSTISNLHDWQLKNFKNKTTYQLSKQAGKQVLSAQSKQSCSGLFKKIKVDLTKTPFIHWSWRIDQRLKNLNEKTKQGDDYAARIFVTNTDSMFSLNKKALNYVWSSQQPKNSAWHNAYVPRAKMIAIRDKTDSTKQWFHEKRNVYKDFKAQFGEHVKYIKSIAIMTDTDDSKQSASSYYGNIYFSAE